MKGMNLLIEKHKWIAYHCWTLW